MSSCRSIFSVLLAVAVVVVCHGRAKPQAAAGFVETKAQRDERMRWWRDARFGMFIHWGIYAVPAGEYLKYSRSTLACGIGSSAGDSGEAFEVQ